MPERTAPSIVQGRAVAGDENGAGTDVLVQPRPVDGAGLQNRRPFFQNGAERRRGFIRFQNPRQIAPHQSGQSVERITRGQIVRRADRDRHNAVFGKDPMPRHAGHSEKRRGHRGIRFVMQVDDRLVRKFRRADDQARQAIGADRQNRFVAAAQFDFFAVKEYQPVFPDAPQPAAETESDAALFQVLFDGGDDAVAQGRIGQIDRAVFRAETLGRRF